MNEQQALFTLATGMRCRERTCWSGCRPTLTLSMWPAVSVCRKSSQLSSRPCRPGARNWLRCSPWHFLFSHEKERVETDPAVVNQSVQIELYNRSASLSSGCLAAVHQSRVRSHVRLLQVAGDHRGPRTWGDGRGGELLLRMPVGVYLATRSSVFSEGFLARVSAHIPDIWQQDQA